MKSLSVRLHDYSWLEFEWLGDALLINRWLPEGFNSEGCAMLSGSKALAGTELQEFFEFLQAGQRGEKTA